MILRTVVAGLLGGLLAVATLQGQPRLERLADGTIVLTRIPDLLADEAVARQLASGLTTSFRFRVARGGKLAGAARADVRFELWDEVFAVSVVTVRGTEPGLQLESEEALASWWGSLRLVVARGEGWRLADAASVEVEILPFSRAEQEDTQRWLADRMRATDPEGEAARVSDGEEALSRVFGILIATSVQPRALARHRWDLRLQGNGEP